MAIRKKDWASMARDRFRAWRGRPAMDDVSGLSEDLLERGLRRAAASMMIEPEGSPDWERATRTHRAMLAERLRRRGFNV